MSWYSDKEPFNEYDPPYCKNCSGGNSKAECDRCARQHSETGGQMTIQFRFQGIAKFDADDVPEDKDLKAILGMRLEDLISEDMGARVYVMVTDIEEED